MYLNRILISLFVINFLCANCLGFFFRSSETGLSAVRKAPRWNMPWLGMGVRCNGCPPHGCEDDEAIIHGFCCGCAYGLVYGMATTYSSETLCASHVDVSCEGSIYAAGPRTVCDRVPVLCPEFLQCPLNLYGLCHDYEYMMNCCC